MIFPKAWQCLSCLSCQCLQGAQLVFETYIKPLMQKYGANIEPAFQRAEQASTLIM